MRQPAETAVSRSLPARTLILENAGVVPVGQTIATPMSLKNSETWGIPLRISPLSNNEGRETILNQE